MATIAGIRFVRTGSIQLAETVGLDVALGDKVVVKTPKGHQLGTVTTLQEGEVESELTGSVTRLASQEDLERARSLQQECTKAAVQAQNKINDHGLPMRVIAVHWSLDKDYVTITFWAEDRVDFRALVRDLARLFSARVELHQVGARERAKLSGGLGRCGRQLCCSLWQTDAPRVTVHMAREQALLQSMPELTGACGRLLCCIRFEYQDYLQGKTEVPPPGEQVATPMGVARVVKRDLMRGRVTVEVRGEQTVDLSALDIRPLDPSESCTECPEPSQEAPLSQ